MQTRRDAFWPLLDIFVLIIFSRRYATPFPENIGRIKAHRKRIESADYRSSKCRLRVSHEKLCFPDRLPRSPRQTLSCTLFKSVLFRLAAT